MDSKKVLNSFLIFSSLTDLKINKPNLNLMKKSKLIFKRLPFSKTGFLPFLLTFLFFAALQVDMKAQTTTLPTPGQIQPPARVMYQLPAGPFVSVPVALDRLMAAVTNLKHQLEQYAEGTAPYEAAYLRYTYYSHIMTLLNSGKGVSESIVEAVGIISSDLSLGATPEQIITEKNAAINLLRP